MIKRTIEISRQPSHLSAKLEQLRIQPFDEDVGAARSIPCEDVGVILVDQPQTTYSHSALQTLMRHGATLVVCGKDHLPAGMLLPIQNHTEQVPRIHDQIAVTQPVKKRLWQQLVKAKITAQASNLNSDSPARRKLDVLCEQVKSGDPSNHEAQAAKVYWSAWLNGMDKPPEFRRNPDGKDPINGMLNYGYAVLRAAVARALVAAGLVPALGIHHQNRSNAFCLADDLVEPFRPLVDRTVRQQVRDNHLNLDQQTKASLLSLLVSPVLLEHQSSPLMVSLHRMTASLLRCYQKADKMLLIPTLPEADV